MAKKRNTINGLDERHVAQIIRRKMMEKKIESKKRYDRNKINKEDNFN